MNPLYSEDDKVISTSGEHLETKDSNSAAGPQDGAINASTVHAMTPEEKAEALAIAQKLDPGLPILTLRNLHFLWIMTTVFVCGGDNGLDGAVMSAVNSFSTFLSYFGLEQAAPRTGIVFGIYTVGGVASFFSSAFLPDLIGRRWTMFFGNTCLMAGALITTFATTMPMFLGGRFLTGFGAASAAQAAKSYVTEMAPANSRGMFMGIYNSTFQIGSILAAGIAIPLGKRTGESGWRLCLAVQVMFPAINWFGIMFCPESPRWLFSRGRKEEAAKILARYHSRDNDPESPLIKLELAELEEQISLSGADKRWWDFKTLFGSRANRIRMGLAVVMSAAGQLQGPAGNYFTVLLKVAGVNNGDVQRLYNFGNSLLTFAAAMLGALIIDRVGRRPLFIGSLVWVALCMFLIGGFLSVLSVPVYANAGIAFIFLFGLGQIGWTTANALYVPEILNFETRAKGLAFQAIFTQSFGLINTFAVPAALVALTWKLYMIFAVWDSFLSVILYFFLVETKGIPLEQMNEIFETKNPRKTADGVVKAKAAATKLKGNTSAIEA